MVFTKQKSTTTNSYVLLKNEELKLVQEFSYFKVILD